MASRGQVFRRFGAVAAVTGGVYLLILAFSLALRTLAVATDLIPAGSIPAWRGFWSFAGDVALGPLSLPGGGLLDGLQVTGIFALPVVVILGLISSGYCDDWQSARATFTYLALGLVAGLWILHGFPALVE